MYTSLRNAASARLHSESGTRRRIAVLVVAALVVALASVVTAVQPAAAAGSPCGPTINPIACENSQTTGVTAQSVWDDYFGAGDDAIQGFSTDISANAGQSISFKIDTTLSYTIDIYRLGYYGGSGARLWKGSLGHSSPVRQPNCLTNPTTELVDCGNWSVSATWAIPLTAVSGVYIAHLAATTGATSAIPFIVRNDSSTSDIVFQTSDETWEAYNTYGGANFYTGAPNGRAYALSYNRPFSTRDGTTARDFLFSNEYPTIRFLERSGYDVSYMSGVDVDRYGSLLLNHKVYMSVGHDEYWSAAQRNNVQAARDAGVNLMFLSGNEMYWHTRFGASIDSSNTSYRTLICYKETWDDAKTDPSSEWTGTWRDPRFVLPPGGGNPENGLTGTMFMSNSDDLAVQVSGAEGKLRLWRNTNLGSFPDSTVTSLAAHTVGYESDEDVDNGFRPAGLVDLSTTVGATPQYLTDFGSTVVPGTTTHHLTLYRANSGALVFGAGTIQWGWGLDEVHDGDSPLPADSRIQQATVNMLADMHALPSTLMPGLAPATASTDTQGPTTTITSPVSGASISNGASVSVSGTATDVGGKVAGVEVSFDAGATWHPAIGRQNWTYTGILHGVGTGSIRARATDDSANIGTVASVSVTAGCPCSIFGQAVPATPDSGDGSAVELGVRFSSDVDGWVSGVRFYKSAANTGTHTGSLWSSNGVQLASGTFVNETSSGWQTLQFPAPVQITKNTVYIVSYYAPNGHYAAAQNYFYYRDIGASPLHAESLTPADTSKLNGVFAGGHGFPTNSFRGTNYYVDALFTDVDNFPPSVVTQSPIPGASSVPTTSPVSVGVSKTLNAASIAFTLTDPAAIGVTGAVNYDAIAKTVTFTPTTALSPGMRYTASFSASDTLGNTMPTPVTWTFTTANSSTPGVCPCTLFADSSAPATVTINDANGVELGVKFTADADGTVTGVRFYKGPLNVGTHVGSLWNVTGQRLATATFASESTMGWQTVTFPQPVAVTAGTTYIASYHTSVGFYSATSGAFATTGVDNFPLHMPIDGSLYLYGAGGFPTNDSTADYGVDAVFTVPATVVPTVASSIPSNGTTSVGTHASVSVTFSTAVQSGSPQISVSSASEAVAGTTRLDAAHRTATFTPAAVLSPGTMYAVQVSGAKSLSGTAMSPTSFSFTTGGTGACPCTLFGATESPTVVDAGDTNAVTLGVRFQASVDGYVTGVRFYKSGANTGVHVGGLWSSAGVRLATATFTNETATGWQFVSFSQPIQLTAGATYVASYYAPTGHYSATPHFFDTTWDATPLTGVSDANGNGVFSYGNDLFPSQSFANTNYWVDLVFQPGTTPDATPPTVTSQSPIDKASSVPVSVTPSATFSEAIDSSSISFTLKDPSSIAVAGAVSYDAASKTATFSPASALARGIRYTVGVAASDTSGNAMSAPSTWSFTTQQPSPSPGVCPCSVWDDTATPAAITVNDPATIELGVKFTSDVDGYVSGVRFYKGPQNTGTHVGSLWSSAGAQLASATFANESSTGWESVSFAAPVAITAGTLYIVSYKTTVGYYSATSNAFQTAGVDNAPLHVPVQGSVYTYNGGFPASTGGANYWVDPVFITTSGSAGGSDPQPPLDTTAPTISAVQATASGSSLTVTWTTDEASTSRVDYGTSATALTSAASTAGSTTSHSVAITGIALNTRYYYRVTSADAAGNSATSPATSGAPATWAPTTTPISDTTTANFSAGTAASTYVTSNGDGDVVLTPTTVTEFPGTTLPAGWTSTAIVTGGKSTVAGGAVTVSGSNLTNTTSYANGKALESLATLGQNQTVGWISTSNANVRMSFTVNASNQLVASVSDGGFNNASSAVVSGWTVTPHKFRIEWTSSAATFYLDDAQKYTHAFTSLFGTSYRMRLSDSVTTDAGLVVDWIRLAPYAASGTFTSRIFDASAPVIWDGLNWSATLPSGTTLTVAVRTGNTPTPDASWTAFATIPTSGGSIGRTSRYLQYRLTMTSTGTRFVTPTVGSVTAAFHV